MAYNLIITEHADELIDKNTHYLLTKFKNPQAAKHLLDGISEVYDRLEDNPYQFSESKDEYLQMKGYREAIISGMAYRIIFDVEEENVIVLGLFHMLEDYSDKVE